MPRERSRRRRSSSSESDSSYERRKSRSKHKRRSRSRDRSESRHRRKKSSSVKRRRRSYSRSVSRDRYESKHKRRSSSHSRSKRSKRSSSRSHSRSHSRSTYKKSKRRKSTSSESSNKSSFDIEPASVHRNLDDTDTKVQKAIEAAESHGLTLSKLPAREYKEVNLKEDMPSIQDRKLLDELNNDSFVQKSFSSSRSKKKNIVIDLNSDDVQVPEPNAKVPEENSIIDFSKLTNEDELTEMWIKKLYLFRRKMLREEN